MTEPAAPSVREPSQVLRAMRGAVGSLRAAAETLERFPAVDESMRGRLLRVLGDEAERISGQLHELEQALHGSAAVSPARRHTTAAAVVEGLREVIRRCGLECDHREPGIEAGDLAATLDVDLETLAAALGEFLAGLRRESEVGRCGLCTRLVDRHLLVDLDWTPDPSDLARVLDWQGAALGGLPGARPDTGLRAAAREHQGETWFTLDRDGATAHVRLLLPLNSTR